MKKTKILLPAMGLIAFATAASVVGSVAWFTASQAYQMTATEFAVVNTKDNLEAELGAGLGTSVNNNTDVVTVDANTVLTDASFDHVNEKFVEPDNLGENIDDIYALNDAQIDTKIVRDNTGTPVIYTAFTWDITFKLSIGRSATKSIGLYLNFEDDLTYMHNKVVYTGAQIAAEGGISATGLKLNADLTGDPVVAEGKLSPTEYSGANTEYVFYREEPEDTGKGLRVAIVPKTVPAGGSTGYKRVWGANNSHADSEVLRYIDTTGIDLTDGNDHPLATSTTAVGAAGMDYTLTHTTKPGKPVSAPTKEGSASVANCLGYFKPGAGETVEMTYTFVAFYEGTDSSIVNTADTIYETMVVGMDFVVANLAD